MNSKTGESNLKMSHTMRDQKRSILHGPIAPDMENIPSNLIHFTSAESFLKIASDRKLLMSPPSALNDFTEVRGGFDILENFLNNTDEGKGLKIRLDKAWPRFWDSFSKYLDSSVIAIRDDIFLSCWCETDINHPDGKLSMWRAYGDDGAGMALEIETTPIRDRYETTEVPVILRHVRYESEDEFITTILNITTQFIEDVDYWKREAQNNGDETVHWELTQAWILASATRKHCGFAEEREWRFMYIPRWDRDALLNKNITVMAQSGKLETRFLFPVEEFYGQIQGYNLEKLLSKVVIGPSTADVVETERSLKHLLQTSGYDLARTQIRHCGTPLRR